MRKASIVLAVVLAMFSATAVAYEIDTHAFITSHAHDRSVMKGDALMKRLGIDRFGSDEETPPFGIVDGVSYAGTRDAYYDLLPAGWSSSFSDEDTRPGMQYDW